MMADILIALISAMAGGGLTSVLVLKYSKKKAKAEAEISELDSVEKAIGIWRGTAEELLEEVKKLREENKLLYFEINKLKSINNRILKALRNITPENARQVVDELSKDIETHV